MSKAISRRTVLRGIGTAVALPALEAMMPIRAFADGAKPPLRMAFCMTPNGVNCPAWFPTTEGVDYELSKTLSPLAPIKQDLLVLSGLAHDKAKANGDGAGDHARSASTFLTGCQARKTDGKDIRSGVSIDQLAAEKLGAKTRLATLEIGTERGAMAGNCDSGYSCAYSSAVSWKTPTMPLPKEVNPRQIFARLFGDPSAIAAERDRAKQALYRKSVLDLVREDATALEKELGSADRRKLEEYQESIRSIERQIQAAESDNAAKVPAGVEAPADGIPSELPAYLRLLSDLVVLAFQTDTTRIATYMFANEGSNKTFPFIEVRDGHHSLSHHGGNKEKLDKIQKIDQFYVEMYGYLVGKLKSVKEGEGTLLDSCMVVYGSAIGDGNRHNHNELPVLFAGAAGGTVKTGRHVRYPKDTPMTNLFLSMLDRVGIPEERFADSTGRLKGLEG
jgi:hypothetical protein